MQPGIFQRQALGLVTDRLFTGEKPHHNIHIVFEQRSHLWWFKTKHCGIGGQCTGAHAHHDSPACQVIEQHHALGYPERVVIRQRHNTGTQSNALRACRGSSHEDLRRGDDLTAGRVVLANPGLVVAQPIEVLEQRQIIFQ